MCLVCTSVSAVMTAANTATHTPSMDSGIIAATYSCAGNHTALLVVTLDQSFYGYLSFNSHTVISLVCEQASAVDDADFLVTEETEQHRAAEQLMQHHYSALNQGILVKEGCE